METRSPLSKPPVIKPFEAVPPGIFRRPEKKQASVLPFFTMLGGLFVLIVGWAIYSAAIVVNSRILFFVCLFVFWVAGSAGIALSAKKKGRSAVAFFFLSIVFSWFLTGLIVACMRKDSRRVTEY